MPAAQATSGRFVRIARFAYFFAVLGFALGTVTLLGPVRWMTSAMRDRGVGQGVEDLAVKGVILLLIAGCAYLAFRLSVARPPREDGRRSKRFAVTTAMAAGALALWFNPSLLTGKEEVPVLGNERFVFGPYPSEAELARLKSEGFVGVISLLHPAVAPFEPQLLREERVTARSVGIELIEAPMLPWVSDNEGSLAKIRSLASAGNGRYYIHCYLGKDRVNVVRRLLESIDPTLTSAAPAGSARSISDATAFERGAILHLADSVHLTPFPTDEEWFGQVLNGTANQIVSLLDPAQPANVPWLEREQKMAADYRIPLRIDPIVEFPFEPDSVLALVARTRALPKPVVVHGFVSQSAAFEAFAIAYETGLPPLPPSLFAEPMGSGAVEVVGPNVAVGPRPGGPDFGGYLQRRGVRKVIYLTAGGTAGAQGDQGIARSVGLTWQSMSPADAGLWSLVARGGPWYLYGPGLAGVRPELVRRLSNGNTAAGN